MKTSVGLKELRQKLVEQSRDPIDMGDYKMQIMAYQRIINELILLCIELAEIVEKED